MDFAKILAARLREHDLDPWIDSERIMVGDNILDGISGGLTTMDLLVFIVSRASLRSSWVQRELEYANAQEIKRKEVLILPFIVDDTPADALPWY